MSANNIARPTTSDFLMRKGTSIQYVALISAKMNSGLYLRRSPHTFLAWQMISNMSFLSASCRFFFRSFFLCCRFFFNSSFVISGFGLKSPFFFFFATGSEHQHVRREINQTFIIIIGAVIINLFMAFILFGTWCFTQTDIIIEDTFTYQTFWYCCSCRNGKKTNVKRHKNKKWHN